MTAIDQWEHRVLHVGVNQWVPLEQQLLELGAEGWETVGIAGADKTVGLNALFAVLKRRVVPPPPPTSTTPDWLPDPCERWEIRYWNGTVWTSHVANKATKETGTDPPQTLSAPRHVGS